MAVTPSAMLAQSPANLHLICCIHDAPCTDSQSVMRSFAAELLAAGRNVTGMTERTAPGGPGGRKQRTLCDVASSERRLISQELGPGSSGCTLDAVSLASACAAIESRIGPGTDLVVINKFGRQEAGGGGLSGAICKAVMLDIPLLISVRPGFMADWHRFAAGLAHDAGPELSEVRDWWNATQRASIRPSRAGELARRASGAC